MKHKNGLLEKQVIIMLLIHFMKEEKDQQEGSEEWWDEPQEQLSRQYKWTELKVAEGRGFV